MDRWIKKSVEYADDMIQLKCPICGDDMLYVHKDNEELPHYCPMCGVLLYDWERDDDDT